MQLKIVTVGDESNCKQDRCPQRCGFCFYKNRDEFSGISVGGMLFMVMDRS